MNVQSEDFQILEDLATGAWYSEVLFTAMDLEIFEALSFHPCSGKALAAQLDCEVDGLERLLAALTSLGLIISCQGNYENGPLASRYLVPGSDSFAGHFMDYRRLLIPHWKRLPARIRKGISANDRPVEEPAEAYEQRVLAYVRAMDFQARIKAADAIELLQLLYGIEPQRILDIGGGAGAWCRTLIEKWPQANAILLDLSETLHAARKLYPNPAHWHRIQPVAGDGRTPCFKPESFHIIILSNILHAYGAEEAQQIIADSAHLLAPQGMLLIHDYFPDGHRTSPLKSRIYDLHMLLNTYNGRIYGLSDLQPMLAASGLHHHRLLHLKTDTSMLLSLKDDAPASPLAGRDMIEASARLLGFDFAGTLKTQEIAFEPWVELKCEFGCARYGKSLTCPPHSPNHEKMKALVSRYTHVLIVQSTPPPKEFHEKLLALERYFLIHGHPEALAFGAGPCAVCPECPADGACLHPEMARPSLEACGVDVYETSRRSGLALEPVSRPTDYVRYVGMVLFKKREDSCAYF
jgi:predicted metal-binding protein/ubiquinone/menaquinone biosynthesis C-methylase UbiE